MVSHRNAPNQFRPDLVFAVFLTLSVVLTGCSGSEQAVVEPPVTLTAIQVSPSSVSANLGTTQQFTATGTFSDGSTQNLTSSVTWNSSSTSVATVSASGLASLVGAGTAAITAASGGRSGTANLTVVGPQAISLSPADRVLIKGNSLQLTATGTFPDASASDLTAFVVWNSSEGGVAAISNSGLATAVAPGTTTLSATLGPLSASTSLSVSQIQIATNNTDILLLKAQAPGGEIIEYLGNKDGQGFATSVNAYRVTTTTGETHSFLLDHESRPVEIQADDGSTFSIVWQSNTAATVTAVSADGSSQVTVAVDLASQGGQSSTASSVRAFALRQTGTPASGSRHSRLAAPKPDLCVEPRSRTTNTPQAVNAATTTVSVGRCGMAENNANVWIVYTSDTQLFALPGSLVGNGVYSVSIPTPPTETPPLLTLCQIVGGVVEAACLVNQSVGTPMLVTACGLIVVSAPGLAIVCEAVVTALPAICATVGIGVPGGPNVAQLLCDDFIDAIDRATSGPVTLRARATIPGAGQASSEPVSAPGTGPFPSFDLQFPGELQIASFGTTPLDPAPFESYVATAEIVCAPPGTQVNMSIVGTDGYTDAISCFVEGNQSCSLFVPGAVEGVVDTVTVQVVGGPARTVVLVF